MHSEQSNFDIVELPSSPIYEDVIAGWDRAVGLAKALYAEQKPVQSLSHQPTDQFRFVAHPIDFGVASQLRRMSPHHAACLDQIRDAAIGLGYKKDAIRKKAEDKRVEEGGGYNADYEEEEHLNKIAEILDPLCGGVGGWEHLLDQVVQDASSTGQGYIEVSRDKAGDINGLFWVTSPTIHIAIEYDRFTWFRQVKAGSHAAGDVLVRDNIPFARFGYIEETLKYSDPKAWNSSGTKGKKNRGLHELIHFKLPTNQWEHYGGPGYMSAVPYIHLVQQMIQQQSDLFHNRGVPDFLLFLLGVNMDGPQWKQLTNSVKAKAGSSNVGKGAVFQISETTDKASVNLVQLADGSMASETISKLHDSMALSICSAHRVPPLLAGITIPGKQGASNELVQALILFEKQVVRRFRRMITRTLVSSLAHPMHGVADLIGEKFEFASIVDQLDMFKLDSMAKAKGEAAAQPDREFGEGSLKRGRSSSSATS